MGGLCGESSCGESSCGGSSCGGSSCGGSSCGGRSCGGRVVWWEVLWWEVLCGEVLCGEFVWWEVVWLGLGASGTSRACFCAWGVVLPARTGGAGGRHLARDCGRDSLSGDLGYCAAGPD